MAHHVKFEPPQELAEKIERDVIDNGTSRQKIIQHALEWYYSESPDAEEISLLKQELRHKEELLVARDKEVGVLTNNLEWLRGEYALVTTKLLPAAQAYEESLSRRWAQRVKKFFGFRGESRESINKDRIEEENSGSPP